MGLNVLLYDRGHLAQTVQVCAARHPYLGLSRAIRADFHLPEYLPQAEEKVTCNFLRELTEGEFDEIAIFNILTILCSRKAKHIRSTIQH